MKLFVYNQYNQKVYLNLSASTRQGLANKIGSRTFYLGENRYTVNEVWAEKDSNNTATGAVVGGLVGALGGPIGILAGGLLGGLFGNDSDEKEAANVKKFNQSR